MAKPIIAYALARSNYTKLGFRLIGVTSRAHKMTYGREVPDGKISHVADYDVVHTFPEGTTEDAAMAALKRADAAFERMREPINEARKQLDELYRHQRNSVLDAAKYGTRMLHAELVALAETLGKPPSPYHSAQDERTWHCPADGTLASWKPLTDLIKAGVAPAGATYAL